MSDVSTENHGNSSLVNPSDESYTTRTTVANVSVDTDANMMYVDIHSEGIPAGTKVSRTVSVDANLDFDESGNVLGVEVFLPTRKN